jgi:hypothetical protein
MQIGYQQLNVLNFSSNIPKRKDSVTGITAEETNIVNYEIIFQHETSKYFW